MTSRFKRRASRLLAAMAIAICWATGPAHAVTYFAQLVGEVFPPDSIPCIIFTLVGVAQADPVAPGSPWFALSPTSPNFQAQYAALLVAAAGGQTVTIVTSGTTVCGYAAMSYFSVAFQ